MCFYFFSYQVFDNYAVTVMIGGEPYTLGLFDTAGEKSSACVIVTTQDLVEMILNMKTYSWFFFFLMKEQNLSWLFLPDLWGVVKLSLFKTKTKTKKKTPNQDNLSLPLELFDFVTPDDKFQTLTSNLGDTWKIRGFHVFKQNERRQLCWIKYVDCVWFLFSK